MKRIMLFVMWAGSCCAAEIVPQMPVLLAMVANVGNNPVLAHKQKKPKLSSKPRKQPKQKNQKRFQPGQEKFHKTKYR
ncbi:MAG TPA: hypothetical protein VJJ26_00555 [Candidatus Babeliales bacterium]|nr:hypothetical protein [Candidatus Babeliales bacterium]